MNTEPIYDASGRFIAGPQTILATRPIGPWTQNTRPTDPARALRLTVPAQQG